MRFILLICVTGFCICARNAPDRLINYSLDKKSVPYIVLDLAEQVGLGYNLEKSFMQTDPECRTFPSIYRMRMKASAAVDRQSMGRRNSCV